MIIKSKNKCAILTLLLVIFLCSMFTMFAFAAETTVLSETNIVEYPVANGEIWFGQKVSAGIILSGGVVTTDGTTSGTIIPGHFEFIDPDFVPEDANDAERASIKFVPDNSEDYTGFSISRSRKVTFSVKAVTPVFIDDNDLPVASEVEAGAKLSTSEITGGAMKNPYVEDEPNIVEGVWEWTNRRTVISESGYYEAEFFAVGYEIITREIYVKIAGETPETTIAECPTVPELTYNPNVTWADIELTGGKAVIKGTETEVEGTFAIKNLTAIPNVNSKELAIVFTPANAEEALPYEFTIPVTVNALPISFGEDLKGTTVDDAFEYEVAPGTMMRDVLSYIEGGLLNYPTPSVRSIEDANSPAENEKVYKVTVRNYTNTNYTGSEAYIKTVFKDVEFTPTVKRSTGSGQNKFFIDCGEYNPQGTFTVYCNGEEIAEVKAGYSFDCEVYTDEGGTYEITTKYNPVENDYFIVSDAFWSITVAPVRDIKVANTSSMPFTVNGNSGHTATIRTGDTIVLEYTMPEFAYWVVTDGKGKTVTLDGVDVNEKKITFTMPDYDLKFSVKTPAQLEQEEAEANCDHLCHSDNPVIQIIWKLLHILFRLFNVQQYCDCGVTHYDAPIFGFIS